MGFVKLPRVLGFTVLAMSLASLAWSSDASAVTGAPRIRHGRELASGAPARAQRAHQWQAPASATRLHALAAARLGLAESLWDSDTRVPLRMWGAGTSAPGSVASADIAARSARQILREHLALLAPGSRPDDFQLVGNDLSGGIRSVGFAQTFAGRPVLGGQISLRFKHDRLVMIGSEALPNLALSLTATPVAAATAQARARAWILQDAAGTATAGAVDGPFILPVITARSTAYHEVLRVTVDATAPIGRFAVYLDAATGQPVAREQLLHFASGTVGLGVPVRGPQGLHVAVVAPRLDVFVNGLPATTDELGLVNFDGGDAAIVAGVVGTLVRVVNEAGPAATKDLSLAPGGFAMWADESELVEAQISAYAHANIVKQRIRSIDPTFAYLDQQLQVTVNIADICNAFSDGDTLNFFQSGQGCENTARIADVVYHEFGHSAHIQGIIPGVGQFEPALSEGIADYLSTTIVDDASLAVGFFLDDPNEPLRELDPVGDEWIWPDDLTGEVHDDGRIIGGTLWDLRKALVGKLGPAAGVTRADHIWFQSIRRAVDIPTMYPEALLADDDDGDLANGTPNECEINLAFAAHGLLGGASATGTVLESPATPNGTPLRVEIAGGKKACVDLTATSATLRFRQAGSPQESTLKMSPEPGGFGALLPNFPDGLLAEYRIVVDFSDGSQTSFPQNDADPWYQKYFGPVTPLFCSGFEVQPGAEGWQAGGQWQWGVATGQAGDPSAPFSGAGMLGVNLDGAYAPFSVSSLRSPIISTAGFPVVRLQYRRWLNVEDGFFDQASILADGAPVWENFNSQQGDFSNVSHRDREWRFHDVDLSSVTADGQVQLEFLQSSDAGLELGGWNIDELCVVGTDAPPANPFCGDGIIGSGESCDDGPSNSNTTPDACRTNCQFARCGDAVTDLVEACDDGNLNAGDGCDPACQIEGPVGTSDTPTTSAGDVAGDADTANPGSDSDTDTDTGGGLDQLDLSDRGCACDGGPTDLPPLAGLGLLALLGLRRRRSASPR